MIPAWLKRQLDAANPDGVTRNARAGRCRRCGSEVVRGLDADAIAGSATCDPQPVDEVGELMAVLAGRATYDLVMAAGRWQVDHRDPEHLRGPRRHPVLPEHRCEHGTALRLPAAPYSPDLAAPKPFTLGDF